MQAGPCPNRAMLGRSLPMLSETKRPKSSRHRPTLSEVGRKVPTLGQICTPSAKSAWNRPNLAATHRCRQNSVWDRPNLARNRPTSTKCGPMSAKGSSTPANIGPSWPGVENMDRHRSNLDRLRPNLARGCPIAARTGSETAQIGSNTVLPPFSQTSGAVVRKHAQRLVPRRKQYVVRCQIRDAGGRRMQPQVGNTQEAQRRRLNEEWRVATGDRSGGRRGNRRASARAETKLGRNHPNSADSGPLVAEIGPKSAISGKVRTIHGA